MVIQEGPVVLDQGRSLEAEDESAQRARERNHIDAMKVEGGMKKTIALASVVLLLGIVLAACEGAPPECPTEELIAPVLASPADGATVNTLSPSLSWSYPANCVPQGYRLDLSRTPDFSDTSLSGGRGGAST